jgi:hypothetical protein
MLTFGNNSSSFAAKSNGLPYSYRPPIAIDILEPSTIGVYHVNGQYREKIE